MWTLDSRHKDMVSCCLEFYTAPNEMRGASESMMRLARARQHTGAQLFPMQAQGLNIEHEDKQLSLTAYAVEANKICIGCLMHAMCWHT
jgi:hypothetical protein